MFSIIKKKSFSIKSALIFSVGALCLSHRESSKDVIWHRANRKYRCRTAVHYSAGNTFPSGSLVSKPDMDCAVFN